VLWCVFSSVLLGIGLSVRYDRSSCVASIHKGILMSHKLVFHRKASIGHKGIERYHMSHYSWFGN
jgi:hypothetical protein